MRFKDFQGLLNICKQPRKPIWPISRIFKALNLFSQIHGLSRPHGDPAIPFLSHSATDLWDAHKIGYNVHKHSKLLILNTVIVSWNNTLVIYTICEVQYSRLDLIDDWLLRFDVVILTQGKIHLFKFFHHCHACFSQSLQITSNSTRNRHDLLQTHWGRERNIQD